MWKTLSYKTPSPRSSVLLHRYIHGTLLHVLSQVCTALNLAGQGSSLLPTLQRAGVRHRSQNFSTTKCFLIIFMPFEGSYLHPRLT